jgi:hypothetical protein
MQSCYPQLLLTLCIAGVALMSSGCETPTTPPDTGNTTPTDTTRVMTTFKLHAMSGTTPLVLNTPVTMETGAECKISMLRFYVSRFYLLDSTDKMVSATLVDDAGSPLAYDVGFCDCAKPETETIRVLAPKGSYHGIVFSIGVPDSTAAGAPLNHADASKQFYPLNVDNDMYWGWNPGYVFFKIEGSSMVGTDWQSFVYHIGDDDHLMTLRLETPFTVKAAGEERMLMMNADRLFVTPSGGHVPNITGTENDRVVHGGSMADTMAVNIAHSGFITLMN